MSRAAPHDAPPMPNWPALMTTELACAYTSLARASFLLLAGRHGVLPVECAGPGRRAASTGHEKGPPPVKGAGQKWV